MNSLDEAIDVDPATIEVELKQLQPHATGELSLSNRSAQRCRRNCHAQRSTISRTAP
jgi:hypothetical protein